MEHLPIDIRSHIASYSNIGTLRYVFYFDVRYAAALYVQRYWRMCHINLRPGNIIEIKRKETGETYIGKIVQEQRVRDPTICVRLMFTDIVHYIYMKKKRDPTHEICQVLFRHRTPWLFYV